MKWKIGSMASVLALMKTKLDFCLVDKQMHQKTQRQPSVSTRMKLAIPQSPTRGSVERFPRDPVKEPTSTGSRSSNTLAGME